MIPVTVVIPVKNEEDNLPDCLKSLNQINEVVVVDSGSTDSTRKIATKYGATLVNFKWDGKFPKKRNWILRNYNIETEWVLFVDADERLTENFISELNKKLKENKYNGFWLTYHDYFQGKLLKYGVPMKKLALFKIGSGEYEKIDEEHWSELDMEIHEHPIVSGNVGLIESPIIHQDDTNLHRYIARHNDYSTWEAKRYISLLKNDKETWDKLTSRQYKKYNNIEKWWWAPMYFLYSYFIKMGFLDGQQGFTFAILKSIYFYNIRCKIKELRRNDKINIGN